MKATIYYGPKNIELEDRPKPSVGPRDALIKNVRAGICGTDLTAYLYNGDAVSIFKDNEFGHEMVGRIEEVGSEVKDLHVGDRVFVNPTRCKRGGMAACDMAGAFSEYVLVEEAKLGDNLFILADHVSYDDAVLCEPLSVSTHGKNVANVKNSDKVAIYGAGTIGLGALLALKAQGVKEIVVIDINDSRLKIAESHGAKTINPSSENLKTALENIMGQTYSHIGLPVPDVDVYIDAAGAPNIPIEFLSMAKENAVLSVLAVYKQNTELNFSMVMSSEAIVRGSCGYSIKDIEEVLSYLHDGKIKGSDLITHHFKHTDIKEAFEMAASGDKALKVVIDYE